MWCRILAEVQFPLAVQTPDSSTQASPSKNKNIRLYFYVFLIISQDPAVVYNIFPKVNLMVRLEFELVYFDVTVQHVSNNATGIPLYFSESIVITVYLSVWYPIS